MDLEQIYREQYRPLVAFITSRIGDPGRAEELAQEAFVRAIRNRPENPRAWLYTVASNLAHDEGRRRSVRQRHLRLVQAEAGNVAPAGPSPESSLELEERRERARAALATLPPRDLQALVMQQEGRSYEEIASRLGLSPGSVGTTLSRARKRLAQAWQARRGGQDDVAR